MKTLVNILKLIYNSVGEFVISYYVNTRTFIMMKSVNKKRVKKDMVTRQLIVEEKRPGNSDLQILQ